MRKIVRTEDGGGGENDENYDNYDEKVEIGEAGALLLTFILKYAQV